MACARLYDLKVVGLRCKPRQLASGACAGYPTSLSAGSGCHNNTTDQAASPDIYFSQSGGWQPKVKVLGRSGS